jgi:hypothetical protein
VIFTKGKNDSLSIKKFWESIVSRVTGNDDFILYSRVINKNDYEREN